MRIRTDDQVQVISGKEKGKQGKVLRTDPKAGTVYVEDLNMIKRHQRAQPSPDGRGQGKEGGIIEMEGPIHVSNVALVDPTDNKPTRIGIRTTDDGKRQRYSKRTGEAI
ncbi:MAG: 50S ribosomal protein L24 [Solirubrobacterales bacterium]|mgnify:FL=1|nr:50S ribosomal protein L24 [Solirubrobacterales bacterium]HRV59211.1 50S ribosomal protein L24 [Solirubrobacterales bacterium]